MAGLKTWEPSLAFGVFKVTPEETDWYRQYVIGFPSISASWFGTFPVAGTAATGTMVTVSKIADYPRNVVFVLAGSAVGMAGTVTVYGKDQFGKSVNETLGFGSANNGGTVEGTQIFSQVSAGTLSFGTAVGNGTASIGVAITGTTARFGLPDKIRGTTDVLAITRSTGVGAQAVNGGTIAAFIDSVTHAIKAPATLTGTQIITVLYKSYYDASRDPEMGTLTQAT